MAESGMPQRQPGAARIHTYHVQLYPTKAQAILLESISAAAAGCTIT
jgi:hypothetical protein